MAKSRTKQPLLRAFGGVLKRLHDQHEERLGRKLSHDALARLVTKRVADRVSPAVTLGGSTLWRWEAGEVASPDPLILRELGDIYDVQFDGLLRVLEANLRDTKLSIDDAMNLLAGVTSPVTTSLNDRPLTERGSDVPASVSELEARIQQLERTRSDHEALISAMSHVQELLTHALAEYGQPAHHKDARAGKTAAKARRGARKAG